MLIRYGYLPRIRTLFEVPSLIPTIQNIHIQSKRKNEQVLGQPIKKQYKKQIKTIDIHSTDDLNDVEYYFEKGVYGLTDRFGLDSHKLNVPLIFAYLV
jgi:hypothetical protein